MSLSRQESKKAAVRLVILGVAEALAHRLPVIPALPYTKGAISAAVGVLSKLAEREVEYDLLAACLGLHLAGVRGAAWPPEPEFIDQVAEDACIVLGIVHDPATLAKIVARWEKAKELFEKIKKAEAYRYN